MLLQRLVEYSERSELPPTGYDKTAIRWIIDLDSKSITAPNFVGTFSTGKKNDRGEIRLAPFRERTSTAIRPKFFADDGEYTFGKAKKGKKGDRISHAKKCHEEYLKLLDLCAKETNNSSVKVISDYLKKWDEKWFPDDFIVDMNFTFRVDGQLLIDNPDMKSFWAKKFWEFTLKEKEEDGLDNEESNVTASEMDCHICGKTCIPVKRHPFKIKRIPKGQSKGNAIISANKSAFTSYGLEASLIAPTCSSCVEDYAKAANALLQDENTHIEIGPLVYIFWTKDETGFSFASLLSKPNPLDVQALIESAYKGKEGAVVVDETKFYASAFSASGSRVAVRDWLETTVGSVKRNLARYFSLQRIAEPNGEPHTPLGLYWLSAATIPLKEKKPDYDQLNPNVPRVLLKCALDGNPIPDWLLFQSVKRTRAEQDVRKNHATIIKMVLVSKETDKTIQEGKMEQLDLTNKEPAYLCGRLLRIIESIQYEAQGKTNTTVVGRFYGSASSAPASVFGILLQRAQANLEKLRKEKEGAYKSLQAKITDITYPDLKSFPKTLNLEQQGLFALGYYHQRAKDIGDVIAYKAQKENLKNKEEEAINE